MTNNDKIVLDIIIRTIGVKYSDLIRMVYGNLDRQELTQSLMHLLNDKEIIRISYEFENNLGSIHSFYLAKAHLVQD